jgi:Bardet-Biedl syndrome 9 protein
MSEHHEARLKLQKTLSELNDLAHQYRVIDKRLLVRFKDRNPAALGGLDILLRETYKSIMMTSDTVEELKELIHRKTDSFDVLGRGLAFLCTLKFGLSPQERLLLESHLCPNLCEATDQGWEETVEASMTYLLKTSLAKSYKV